MLNLEEQIFNQLTKAKSVLVLFSNTGPSSKTEKADSLAGALALFLFLKGLKKEVDIVSSGQNGSRDPLTFLPAAPEIRNNIDNLRRFIVSLNIAKAKVNQIKYTVEGDRLNFIVSPASGWFSPDDVSSKPGEFKYDLVLTVGITDLASLGRVYDDNIEFFYKTTVINIDRHAANEEYGQINYVDINSIAVCEVIYYLLKNFKSASLTDDMATCLLTGIIEQTRNFKTPNLTPRTLLTASELITAGARREEIVDHLYRSRSLSSLKLWGKILNNLKSEKNGALLWSKISDSELRETGATTSDLTDIVDELIATVPTAKVIAVICGENAIQTRVIVYSLRNVSALNLIAKHNPQGTIKMAQALINLPLDDVCAQIVGELEGQLDKLTP